ncbi:MAG: hypothetical protein PVJ39_21800 [Gammaproteobacteria bacterium]|jgi:hypothetical protein
MFSKISAISSFIILVAITGCSFSVGNIPTEYTLNPKKGVVVISLTSSGECGYALFVDIRRIDKTHEKTIGLQDVVEQRDWKRKNNECASDLNDYSGKLVAIDLEPGVYEIYQFSGLNKYHAFSSVYELSIKFKVTENEVTHIGNAHFVVSKREYDFIVSDKRQRDLPLFVKKYPNISEDYIIDLLEPVTCRGA